MPMLEIGTYIFYLGLVLICALIYDRYWITEPVDRKCFWYGLGFKILCSLGFIIVYYFVLPHGDTLGYFRLSGIISSLFWEDPLKAINVLLWEPGDFSFEVQSVTDQMRLYKGTSTGTVVKVAAVVGIFCFQNFYVMSLLFGCFAFWGMWKVYKVLSELFPRLSVEIGVATMMIPSVSFWSAGIMKDSITLGCMGIAIGAFYELAIKKRKVFIPIVLMLLCFLMIWRIKFYIAISIAPALILWFFLHHFEYLEGKGFKFLAAGLLGFVALVLGYYFFPIIQKSTDKIFSLFVDKALDFHGYHGMIAEAGGSGYSLGEIEFTPIGILKKVPASWMFCFYRPFFTEVTSAVSVLGAVENFILLLFSIYVFLKTGLLRAFKLLMSRPVIIASLFFVLLFGFITGFTSYNYGSLMRYRIPCMPFFVFLLFFILREGKRSFPIRRGNSIPV